MTSSLAASAVLAVYNSETTIRPCLNSLLTQSLPIEIIVVDDGSNDGTVKIIKEYQGVKLLTQSHSGPAIARNLGAKHAKSGILLFVDADMTFEDEYVKKLIEPIRQKKVIGTYTVDERVANWENVWARCWNIQEGWEDKKRFPPNPPKYGTDFRAILKVEFDKVNGFDDIGYTDTWSLFSKLKVRPLRTHAVCYHKNPDNLFSVFRQARWSSKRPYKLGAIGMAIALIRTSLPISICMATIKSVGRLNFAFFFFKLVYDWGRFVGIVDLLITGNKSK